MQCERIATQRANAKQEAMGRVKSQGTKGGALQLGRRLGPSFPSSICRTAHPRAVYPRPFNARTQRRRLHEEFCRGPRFVCVVFVDTPASKIQMRRSSFGLCAVPRTSRSRVARSRLCLAGLSAYAKRNFPGRASCGPFIQKKSYVELAKSQNTPSF